MKLSPPMNHPPLKKNFFSFKGKMSLFSKKGKPFRWVVLLSLLSVFVFGLIFFLESIVEPRMGVNLWTGESVALNEAAPPVLEKTRFSQDQQRSEGPPSLLEEKQEGFFNTPSPTVSSPPPPHPEVSALQERLGYLEAQIFVLIKQEEQQRKLGTAFILLRQDILQGLPFDHSLHCLEALLPPEEPLRENFDQLTPFAQQGVWPLKKIVSQFSENYVLYEPEQKGFLATFLGFFKKLWTVRRTDQAATSLEQELRAAEIDLHQGNIEGALEKLGSFSLAPTAEAKEWFQKAQQFSRTQKTLRIFEEKFFQSSPLQGPQG